MRHLNKHKIFVKNTVIISSVVFAALIFFSVYMVNSWPRRTLENINVLIDNKEYLAAESMIEQYEAKEDKELKDLKDLCSYNIALNEIEIGNTEEARYRLNNLDGYDGTPELLLECSYIDANQLVQNEKYEDAYLIFAMLLDYKNSSEMMLETRYMTAQHLYEEGNLASALEIYLSLADYKNAKDRGEETAMQITGADTIEEANKILEGVNLLEMQKIAKLTAARSNILEGVLAVGANHTVGLMADGSVVATGLNDNSQCQVDDWSDIVAIDAGAYNTIGLKSDGTVVATGRNDEGQCDVGNWVNVVQIASGAYTTYGLLEDGTIVSTGYSDNQKLDNLTKIKLISAGAYSAGCINEDGIIFFSHPSLIIHEEGAISIDTSTGYAIALMPDGNIVSTLNNTPDWENVVAIYAGSNMILAIDCDLQILTHFFDSRDQVPLDEYTDIKAIAVGGSHCAIMFSDGSVKVFGSNEYGECDVDNWILLNSEE